MKKVLLSLLGFVPLFAIIAGVNVYVDPANLFRADIMVESVYDITSSGKNANNVSDYRDRLFVEKRILDMTAAPENVVLGSSHGAQIDSAILDGETFNSCVTGATIEDVAAIYEIYQSTGLLPKRYILSVDTWFFDENKNDNRCELYLGEYYERFVKENVDESFSVNPSSKNKDHFDFEGLFSLSYFQTSAYHILDGSYVKFRTGAVPADDNSLSLGMVKVDGSYVYPVSYSCADTDTVNLRAMTARDGVVTSLRDSGGMSIGKRELFEALVRSIISDGSELVIIESPYHPIVYDSVLSEPLAAKNLLEIESYLTRFCEKNDIALFGSYNPYALDFGVFNFIDGLHIDYETTAELLSSINLSA